MSPGQPARSPWSAGRFAREFSVSRETLDRLETYHALLLRWQPVKNLVAPQSLPEAWQRHFADSAQLLPFVTGAESVVDIGSGAGFPGLVLAILLAVDSDARVHLVESNARKCAFLRDVARQTSVTVTVHCNRIEEVDRVAVTGALERAVDVVTARALAPLERLLGLAEPLIGSTGRGVFLKGVAARDEAADARRSWGFECTMHPSKTDPDGRIVEVGELKPLKGEPH